MDGGGKTFQDLFFFFLNSSGLLSSYDPPGENSKVRSSGAAA